MSSIGLRMFPSIPRADARRAHQPVRTVDPVGGRFESGLPGGRGELGRRLVRVQDGAW
jgi:hypothetical protein